MKKPLTPSVGRCVLSRVGELESGLGFFLTERAVEIEFLFENWPARIDALETWPDLLYKLG